MNLKSSTGEINSMARTSSAAKQSPAVVSIKDKLVAQRQAESERVKKLQETNNSGSGASIVQIMMHYRKNDFNNYLSFANPGVIACALEEEGVITLFTKADGSDCYRQVSEDGSIPDRRVMWPALLVEDIVRAYCKKEGIDRTGAEGVDVE